MRHTRRPEGVHTTTHLSRKLAHGQELPFFSTHEQEALRNGLCARSRETDANLDVVT